MISWIGFLGNSAIASNSPSRAYEEARHSYFLLKADKKKQQLRHNWQNVIEEFQSIAAKYPKNTQSVKALYTAAELWRGLYAVSFLENDLDNAIAAYERVASEYTNSNLADDALWHQAQLILQYKQDETAATKVLDHLLEKYPSGDMAASAQNLRSKIAPSHNLPKESYIVDNAKDLKTNSMKDNEKNHSIKIEAIKHWSNPEYSRIVLYFSHETKTREHIKNTNNTSITSQITVDIIDTQLAANVYKPDIIKDELVADVQFIPNNDGVSLKLSFKQPIEYRLLTLENPYRFVIDSFVVTTPEQELTKPALKTRRVVIDPGHGGRDSGARSASGLLEKKITLSIAKKIQSILINRGIDAILTRNKDITLSLEERTAIANRVKADLFISIHTNAHKNKNVSGIETYYLNTTDDRYSLRLAARENATQEKHVSDLQLMLADLATKANTAESQKLAFAIQNELVNQLRPINSKFHNKGVKGSLFYVLLGARMPAVLVETAFISNPVEAKLLQSTKYQKTIANAVADAVSKSLAQPLIVAQP
ncbi:MAG: N-acetylmuramoyl-L-alanine amidase [Deltaproteobacteria bacterium]|nr:N-acetylmuramoyl-L-alanine amidase [Deltaproteobacteria bacterium]